MCEKRNGCPNTVDKCIRNFIDVLNGTGWNTVGCCCGHGKYPITIICKNKLSGFVFDLVSGIEIPRKRRFYRKDKEGIYYLPEVVNENVKNC